MADEMGHDELNILSTLFEPEEVEGISPPLVLITLECIPHPRWQVRRTAHAAGQTWNWSATETQHLANCRFCSRREQIINPTHTMVPTVAPDNVRETVSSAREIETHVNIAPSESQQEFDHYFAVAVIEAAVKRAIISTSGLDPLAVAKAIEIEIDKIVPRQTFKATQQRTLSRYISSAYAKHLFDAKNTIPAFEGE
jgi:hypothetical protein